jgi:alpha-L-rhamnosidase
MQDALYRQTHLKVPVLRCQYRLRERTSCHTDQPADYCRPAGSFSNSGGCRAILPNYMLRKAFTVDPVSAHGKVVSARVYSTDLGWNDMTVNGSKTEPNTWMNPGFTAYDQTVLYSTDDVTALIQQDATRPKTNVVATQLAAGRYNSTNSTGGHAFEFVQWRTQEVLRADLYVKYADGTEQLVQTDPSWQVRVCDVWHYRFKGLAGRP